MSLKFKCDICHTEEVSRKLAPTECHGQGEFKIHCYPGACQMHGNSQYDLCTKCAQRIWGYLHGMIKEIRPDDPEIQPR